MPLAGSKRGSRASPVSITARTPGSVTLLSATLVAKTTRRCAPGANTRACSSTLISPCSAQISAFRPASKRTARSISALPGKKHNKSPVLSTSASSTARLSWLSGVSRGRAARYRISTGKLRPAETKRGASRKRASRSPSSVADITTKRRSGRTAACTSKHSARPRSLAKLRSWNSSKITAEMPSNSGSSCSRRVRMPSVTISMRVWADILRSKRMR